MRGPLLSVAIAAMIAAPAGAAEPRHCHRSAPADAPATTEEQNAALTIIARGTHVIPVMFRRYCRLAGPKDQAYLLFSLRGTGCGPESDLAKEQLLVMSSDPEGLAGYDRFDALSVEGKAAFCQIADEMPLPVPELESRVKWVASHEAYTEAISQLFKMLSGADAEETQ